MSQFSTSVSKRTSPWERVCQASTLKDEPAELHYREQCWRVSAHNVLLHAQESTEHAKVQETVYRYFRALELHICGRIELALKKLPKEHPTHKRVSSTFEKYRARAEKSPSEVELVKEAVEKKSYTLPFTMYRNVFLPLLTIVETELAILKGVTAAKDQSELITINLADKEWKQIGHGGFSSVYAGTWKGSAVALKKLNDTDYERAFQYEKEVLQRLGGSRHILQYIAHSDCRNGLSDLSPCIITELAWKDLTSFSARWLRYDAQNWSLASVLSLVIQATAAVSICHAQGEKGVVHGDVKRDNFLVTRDGLVKLADFGFASDEHLPKSLHHYHWNVGTPTSMCPSVLLGTKFRSHSSDIFALGVLIWELGAVDSYLASKSTKKPRDFGRKNPEGPDASKTHPLFQKIVRLCCQKDYKKRPSARQLLEMLYELADGAFDSKLWDERPVLKEVENDYLL